MIRVNSQSGKGGVAWVLQQDQGLKLPKRLQAHFSRAVQKLADETSRELNAADIWEAFQQEYKLGPERRFQLVDYQETRSAGGDRVFTGTIRDGDAQRSVSGRGNGIISSVLSAHSKAALASAWKSSLTRSMRSARAATRALPPTSECTGPGGETLFGVGIDEDVATASVRAVLGAASSL